MCIKGLGDWQCQVSRMELSVVWRRRAGEWCCGRDMVSLDRMHSKCLLSQSHCVLAIICPSDIELQTFVRENLGPWER